MEEGGCLGRVCSVCGGEAVSGLEGLRIFWTKEEGEVPSPQEN